MCVTRINKNEIQTSGYRKATNRSIYINWYSHVPSNWKAGTLRKLLKGACWISNCPSEGWKNDYVGETKRRIVKRIKYHSSKDNGCHLLKHVRENGQIHVWRKIFRYYISNSNISNNYQSKFKPKNKCIFVYQLKPMLYVNE